MTSRCRLTASSLVFSAVCMFHTTAAIAQCVGSVTVPPGGTVNLGIAEGKKFVEVKSAAYGTVAVVPSGNTQILQYTAKIGQADISETVDCQIVGEQNTPVEVSIKAIPTPAPETIYGSAAKTLVLLFALAVLLESALAGLFRWRPFTELFNPRAVRPLVAAILAYWFVVYFKLDMVTALVNASNPGYPKEANSGGQLLTALVLAGGSAGVNSILVGLGFRQVSTPETLPKPRPDKAWISVRAVRKPGTTGSIDVLMGPVTTLSNGVAEPPFVGTIRGKSGLGFLSFFTIDRGRFPNYGGHEVDITQEITVELRGDEHMGTQPIAKWGPHKPAPGAIIDLELTL